MKKAFYIAVPWDYLDGKWIHDVRSAEEMMSLITGVKGMVFVCNYMTGRINKKIYRADIYQVPYRHEEDITAFKLKFNFEMVDRAEIWKD